MNDKKTILVAVTAGIAAYKSLSVISALKKVGYNVKVIGTPESLKFVTKQSLVSISNNEYYEDTDGNAMHVTLANECDAMVIIPATANTIAKITYGIADNIVTTTFLALPKFTPKVIVPAMNNNMYENPVTQENLSTLENRFSNLTIVSPIEGQLACGTFAIGKIAPTKDIIKAVDCAFKESRWVFPLKLNKSGTTNDSFSYLDYDIQKSVEIPIHPHCGSFGIRRKHDVHKGIDLYAPIGTPVFSVEDCEILEIIPFTGKAAGYEWWEDTYGIYAKGKSGIVVYGELLPTSDMVPGLKIKAGTLIGHVAKVLKKDKGRPTSMLHLELHDDRYIHTKTWEIRTPKPQGLLDPTQYLIHAKTL